jgi:hypothetical protein
MGASSPRPKEGEIKKSALGDSQLLLPKSNNVTPAKLSSPAASPRQGTLPNSGVKKQEIEKSIDDDYEFDF